MNHTSVIHVTEASQVGEARRIAVAQALEIGVPETERGKLAIVVTEAANNLVRHAGQGEVLVRRLFAGDRVGIEILALDRGPGMHDVQRCLQDGYSTAGTPGTGLGAIVRQSTLFDIHSRPGLGTALLSQVWNRAAPASAVSRLECGAVCVPYPGEQVCGDGWADEIFDHGGRFMVVDGLGHGMSASRAARLAEQTFAAEPHRSIPDLLRQVHETLRGTRGAAIAMVDVDLDRSEVRFAGVGNIAGILVFSSESRSMVSHNGTMGVAVRKIQEFAYPWHREGLLVMSSDGLSHPRWDRYAGLSSCHPSLIAGVLFRDFKRGRDDATVLVIKERESGRG